jgi:deoxynucleoside triphosphate triphosphohydrolase SAMHD1
MSLSNVFCFSQHRVGTVIGRMYTDALLAANDAVKIHACGSVCESDCRFVKMSEAIDYPPAYARLTDSVVRTIEYSADPALAESRDILRRIRTRELYGFVGTCITTALSICNHR